MNDKPLDSAPMTSRLPYMKLPYPPHVHVFRSDKEGLSIKQIAQTWDRTYILELPSYIIFSQALEVVQNIQPHTVLSVEPGVLTPQNLSSLAAEMPDGCAFFLYYRSHAICRVAEIAAALKPGRILYLSGNPSTSTKSIESVLSNLKNGTALYIGPFAKQSFMRKLNQAWLNSSSTLRSRPEVTELHFHPEISENDVEYAKRLLSIKSKFEVIIHQPSCHAPNPPPHSLLSPLLGSWLPTTKKRSFNGNAVEAAALPVKKISLANSNSQFQGIELLIQALEADGITLDGSGESSTSSLGLK